jgi:purine-cytosine permease-like protein
MVGVLVLMGVSASHAIELWTSILVAALFLVGYWVKCRVQANKLKN